MELGSLCEILDFFSMKILRKEELLLKNLNHLAVMTEEFIFPIIISFLTNSITLNSSPEIIFHC
jgi:K+-transporting ATPase A subunit